MNPSPFLFRDDGPLAQALPARPTLPAGVAVVPGTVGLLVPAAALVAPRLVVPAIALGFVAGLFSPRGPRVARGLDWLVPPSLRALEYGTILALAWSEGGRSPLIAFLALGAIGYHHYDAVYRARTRGELPPAWLTATLGGWEGRTLATGLAAATGVLGPWLLVVAAWCTALGVAESVRYWRSVEN